MRVLITGGNGGIGSALVDYLLENGDELRTFDRTAARRERTVPHAVGDLRDIRDVRRAVEGVEAVAHFGAIPSDDGATPEDVYATNVLGTLHVLQACAEAGIKRVVFCSSVNALGNVGAGLPASHFPIADDYPRHPQTPYQLSKHLGEEACASYSQRYTMTTVCLRPMWVLHPPKGDELNWWQRMSMEQRAEMFRRDYWGYVDVRDVCAATLLGLRAEGITHDAFLLAAADTTIDTPTEELVSTYYPETPWPKIERDSYLAGQPFRSLIDTTHAAKVLGWRPQHSWRESMPASVQTDPS